MRRWICVSCIFIVALTVPVYASAQGGPIADASADSSPVGPASAPSSTATANPTPHPSESAAPEPPPRAVRGPAVRERAGRRSRGGSVASGALMLFMLIAFMGYYVVKKLRR